MRLHEPLQRPLQDVIFMCKRTETKRHFPLRLHKPLMLDSLAAGACQIFTCGSGLWQGRGCDCVRQRPEPLLLLDDSRPCVHVAHPARGRPPLRRGAAPTRPGHVASGWQRAHWPTGESTLLCPPILLGRRMNDETPGDDCCQVAPMNFRGFQMADGCDTRSFGDVDNNARVRALVDH